MELYCEGCRKKVQSEHSHEVNKKEAAELSRILPHTVRTGARLCCDHWEPHTYRKFSLTRRPDLKREFNGLKFIGKRKRESHFHRTLPVVDRETRENDRVARMSKKRLRREVHRLQRELDAAQQDNLALRQSIMRLATVKAQGLLKYYTGFSEADFNQLIALIEKKPLKRLDYTTHDALLWGLAFLYRDMTWRDLSVLTKISDRHVKKRVVSTLEDLYQTLGNTDLNNVPHFLAASELKKHTAPELQEKYPNTCIFVVDGTFIPILDPTDSRSHRLEFCAYKHTTCFKFFLITSLKGFILYVSPPFPGGTKSDAGYWKQSGVSNQLGLFYGTQDDSVQDGDRFSIFGDKAYPFIDVPEGWTVRVTKTATEATRNRKVSPHVHFDPTIAPYRSVVERSIGMIKRFRKLTGGRLHESDIEELKTWIPLIAILVNRRLQQLNTDNEGFL